jgi:hypothetical protein
MSRYIPSFSRVSLVLIALLLPAVSALAQPATGPFNVRTYGATGASNCSADTTGVFAAIAAIPASGGELYFPAGTYCLTSTMLFTDKSIAIRGEGQNLSIIRWDAGGDGITLVSNSTTSRATLTVKSLTILSNKSNVAAAIAGYWGPGMTVAAPAASITDVEIKTTGPAATWTVGIQLSNASKSVITRCNIDGVSPDVGQAAIRFMGQTLQATVSASGITFWMDGIQFIDYSEGLHVSDVEIVGVRRGIVLDSINVLPGTSIANNHISASDKGIYIWQHNAVAISGNLIFSTNYATDFKGIHAINVDSMRITGNHIVWLASSGYRSGIVLEGNSSRNVIGNNTTDHMEAGLWLTGTGVSATVYTGNLNRFCTYQWLDWATPGANLFANNF